MKIATWNVNGIRAREEQFRIWLEQEQPDVVCLQEIKAASFQIPMTICDLDGYSCFWHGAGAYSGVALHVKKSFAESPEFFHPDFDYESRMVAARLGKISVASVYVPNGGKDFPAKMKFLDSLERYVGDTHAQGTQLILCGDLNVAHTDRDVHPKERKAQAIGQLPEERAALDRILSKGLTDVMRFLHPEDDQLFTWWAPWRNLRQRNIGWRIDYILVSTSLADHIGDCSVFRETGTSDHAPVVAKLELPHGFETGRFPGTPLK